MGNPNAGTWRLPQGLLVAAAMAWAAVAVIATLAAGLGVFALMQAEPTATARWPGRPSRDW